MRTKNNNSFVAISSEFYFHAKSVSKVWFKVITVIPDFTTFRNIWLEKVMQYERSIFLYLTLYYAIRIFHQHTFHNNTTLHLHQYVPSTSNGCDSKFNCRGANRDMEITQFFPFFWVVDVWSILHVSKCDINFRERILGLPVFLGAPHF